MRLTAFVTLTLLVLASSFAGDPSLASGAVPGAGHGLAPFVGSWQTEYKDSDGENKQIWTMKWNAKKTFLDFQTLTILNEEVIFVGVGFILYSEPESAYRMYLMMDNGALHESIGEKTAPDEFRFTTKTWANAGFPDHLTEIALAEGEMLVTYLFDKKDGTQIRSESVFKKLDR